MAYKFEAMEVSTKLLDITLMDTETQLSFIFMKLKKINQEKCARTQ